MSERSLSTRRWPVQKRSQERLDRVLRVAETIIKERGFSSLNLKEVSEIADVNIATIYAYFPNSQTLLRTLSERILKDLESRAEEEFEKIAALKKPEKIVDGIVDLTIRFHEENPAWNAIWRGMQSDNQLLQRDVEDTIINSRSLERTLAIINPSLGDRVPMIAILLTVTIGSVLRLSEGLDIRQREEARRELRRLLKQMLIF